MLGFLFAGILLPMFARLISNKGNLNEIIVASANIIIPISLGLVAFSFIYSQEIMLLLYKDHSEVLTWIFRIVMASFPAYCIMYIYSTLLTANGNIKLLIAIAIAGSILSVGLNALLIIKYQALGAAITAFVVEWILALAYIFYCIRKFSLPIQLIWVLKFVLYFIFMLGLNMALKKYTDSLIISIITNSVAFLGLVYGLKFWDKKILVGYFKSNT
jgi:O-antigen/teichoic acid export membrane protein